MAGDVSSRPKTRSAETMADCITEYFAPRSRMGRKKRPVYSMNATSPPNVRAPARICPPPYQRSRARATDPMTSTAAYRDASKKVERNWAARSSSLSPAKRLASARSRAKSWMTVIPWSDSCRNALRRARCVRTRR